MSSVEPGSERTGQSDGSRLPCPPSKRNRAKPRSRIVPALITVGTMGLARLLRGAPRASQQAVANLDQARVNLERPRIRSPVDGYVTNLLTQLGDYATIGQKTIAIVDASSFWVDGFFEETSLGKIHEGDPSTIKLLGYSQVIRGHVVGVSR